jgi:hypothetical protein
MSCLELSRRGKPSTGLTATCLAYPVLLGLLSFTAGCENPSPYVPVRGTVTLDGKPLESGIVQLQPSVGQVATGSIGAGGEFTLSTPPQGQGVLAGSYRVTVLAYDSAVTDPGPEHLIVPVRYTRSGTSGLQVTIFPGSTAPVKFELVSEAPPADGEASRSSAVEQPAAALVLEEDGTPLGDVDVERSTSATAHD